MSEQRGQIVVVSFSGGKDSLAVLLLELYRQIRKLKELQQNKGNKTKVVVFYNNTTLEHPITEQYVQWLVNEILKKSKSINELLEIELVIGKPEKNIFEYILEDWKKIPNGRFRKCSMELKSVPITKWLSREENLKLIEKGLIEKLVFGIRKSESSNRSVLYEENLSPEEVEKNKKLKRKALFYNLKKQGKLKIVQLENIPFYKNKEEKTSDIPIEKRTLISKLIPYLPFATNIAKLYYSGYPCLNKLRNVLNKTEKNKEEKRALLVEFPIIDLQSTEEVYELIVGLLKSEELKPIREQLIHWWTKILPNLAIIEKIKKQQKQKQQDSYRHYIECYPNLINAQLELLDIVLGKLNPSEDKDKNENNTNRDRNNKDKSKSICSQKTTPVSFNCSLNYENSSNSTKQQKTDKTKTKWNIERFHFVNRAISSIEELQQEKYPVELLMILNPLYTVLGYSRVSCYPCPLGRIGELAKAYNCPVEFDNKVGKERIEKFLLVEKILRETGQNPKACFRPNYCGNSEKLIRRLTNEKNKER